MEDVNWSKQAKEFLRLHGWKMEKDIGNVGFHPCFPLGQDFSSEDESHECNILNFVRTFYKEAWDCYKAYIESLVVLEEAKQEREEEEKKVVKKEARTY